MKNTLTKFVAIAALLCPLLASATPALNPMVTNGSFEDYEVPTNTWRTFGSGNGWTTGSYGVEIRDGVAGVAYAGSQFAELDTYQNSSISQTIATTAGQTYNLSFWYAPRVNVSAASNGIQALWNGDVVASVTGDGSVSSSWSNYSASFAGTGGLDTLTFRAVGTSESYGGSLDNISMTAAVPEPEAYAMLIAGLGLMGAVARRRKAKQA